MELHDFILRGGPQEFLLTPRTDDAKEWFSLHIEEDTEILDHGVLVLPVYLDDILTDVDDDGLSVQDEATHP